MKSGPLKPKELKGAMSLVNYIDTSHIMDLVRRDVEAYGTSFCSDVAEIIYSKIVLDMSAPVEPTIALVLVSI